MKSYYRKPERTDDKRQTTDDNRTLGNYILGFPQNINNTKEYIYDNTIISSHF